MPHGLQMERLQMKVFNYLQLSADQKAAFAGKWRSWFRRRIALDRQLAEALQRLRAALPGASAVPAPLQDIITAAAGAVPPACIAARSATYALHALRLLRLCTTVNAQHGGRSGVAVAQWHVRRVIHSGHVRDHIWQLCQQRVCRRAAQSGIRSLLERRCGTHVCAQGAMHGTMCARCAGGTQDSALGKHGKRSSAGMDGAAAACCSSEVLSLAALSDVASSELDRDAARDTAAAAPLALPLVREMPLLVVDPRPPRAPAGAAAPPADPPHAASLPQEPAAAAAPPAEQLLAARLRQEAAAAVPLPDVPQARLLGASGADTQAADDAVAALVDVHRSDSHMYHEFVSLTTLPSWVLTEVRTPLTLMHARRSASWHVPARSHRLAPPAHAHACVLWHVPARSYTTCRTHCLRAALLAVCGCGVRSHACAPALLSAPYACMHVLQRRLAASALLAPCSCWALCMMRVEVSLGSVLI
jgi:hypothetical protein